MNRKENAPSRSVTEVGAGDFVKIGQSWQKIISNTAFGAEKPPRTWSVTTEDGRAYSMFDIKRYAKSEDII